MVTREVDQDPDFSCIECARPVKRRGHCPECLHDLVMLFWDEFERTAQRENACQQ